MKILFEVPDNIVELAKDILLNSCDTEKDERRIEMLCQKAKEMDSPILIDPNKAFHVEKKKQMKELNLAMAMIAIGSMRLGEEEVIVL